MNRQSDFMGAITNLISHGLRVNRASGHVVRIFERDEACLRLIINARSNALLDLRPRQHAVFAINGPDETPGKRSQSGHLIVEDVAALLADDLLPVMGMDLDGDLVAH